MNLPRFKFVIRDLGLALAAGLTLAGCLHDQHQVLSSNDWSPLSDRMGDTARRDWDHKAGKKVQLAQPTRPNRAKIRPLTPTPPRSTVGVQRQIVPAEPMKPRDPEPLKTATTRKPASAKASTRTASITSNSTADPFLNVNIDPEPPVVAATTDAQPLGVKAIATAKKPAPRVSLPLPKSTKVESHAAEAVADEQEVRVSANSPMASLVSARKTQVNTVTDSVTAEPAATADTELEVPTAVPAVPANALASGPSNPLPKKPVRSLAHHNRAATTPVARDPVEILAGPSTPSPKPAADSGPKLVARQASVSKPLPEAPAAVDQLPEIRPAGTALDLPAAPIVNAPIPNTPVASVLEPAKRDVVARPVTVRTPAPAAMLVAPATLPGRIRPQMTTTDNPISFSSIEEVEELPPSPAEEPFPTEVAVENSQPELETSRLAANVASADHSELVVEEQPSSGTPGPLLPTPGESASETADSSAGPSLGPVPEAPTPVNTVKVLEGSSQAEPFVLADLLKVGARWTTGARIGLGIGITGLLGLILWRLLDVRRYRSARRKP